MGFETLLYYAGFLIALALCWGLGPIFFYPMLADVAFDVAGNVGLFTGWDVRWIVVSYGFGMLLWVLALAGALTKPTFIAVMLMDLGAIFYRIIPQFQMNGSGQDFWNLASTGINEIWMVSIFVIVASMAIRSSIIAKMQGRRVDLLTNPKKRFLLPVGAWAGFPPFISCFEHWLPSSLVDGRFMIAGQLMVWGWVALELPPYLTHKRLMKRMS
ncbi:MAG TPA: hypothetical protein VGL38_01080 [bacterium]|jgi:hypothetical protein